MCSDIFSQTDKQINKQRSATKNRTLENESYLRYLDPTTRSLILNLSDLTIIILDLHTLNIVIGPICLTYPAM